MPATIYGQPCVDMSQHPSTGSGAQSNQGAAQLESRRTSRPYPPGSAPRRRRTHAYEEEGWCRLFFCWRLALGLRSTSPSSAVMGRPSGHLARTSWPSASSKTPERSRSIAAHATMTPLSVQRRGGGTTIRHVPSPLGAGVCAQSSPSLRRSSALAATPPERTRVFGVHPSASACAPAQERPASVRQHAAAPACASPLRGASRAPAPRTAASRT